MAKSTFTQKMKQVLVFLMAIRHRAIASVLAQHGFTKAELDRGWQLLSRLSTSRYDARPMGSDPTLVVQLDQFENKWFPIAEAALGSNFPLAAQMVFKNLSQTSGPEVVMVVKTLLDRIEALPREPSEGGLGEIGRAARELLERRGITGAVVAEGRELIARIGDFAPGEPEPVASEIDQAAAEEVWAWYREWSRIARVTITDRRLLRSMGFLQNGGADDEDVGPPVVDPDPTDPAVPAS